jgi:hypothetical protein
MTALDVKSVPQMARAERVESEKRTMIGLLCFELSSVLHCTADIAVQ